MPGGAAATLTATDPGGSLTPAKLSLTIVRRRIAACSPPRPEPHWGRRRGPRLLGRWRGTHQRGGERV